MITHEKGTNVVLNRGEVLVLGQSEKPVRLIANRLASYTKNQSFSLRLHGPMNADVLVAKGSVDVSRSGDSALYYFHRRWAMLSHRARQFAETPN